MFIFRPEALPNADPKFWELPEARLVAIPSHGERLVGWWVAPPRPDAPVLMIVHGRSANISTRVAIVRQLARDGFGVLIFDYRGYGASSGHPNEANLSEDANAAYDWLMSHRVDPRRLAIVGQSLGNSPAAKVAASRRAAALVLVSPYTTLPAAAAERCPWLPVRFLPWRRNRFEVAPSVAAYQGPVILVASASDGMVPLRNSQELATFASRPLWVRADAFPHDGLLSEVTLAGKLTSALRLVLREPIVPTADPRSQPAA